MAYLLRTHIKKKYLIYGLTSVFGIGNPLAKTICFRLGFQKNFLVKNLTDEHIYQLTNLIEELKILIKGDLKRWIKQKIDHLSTLRVYRGIRHRQGLPLRGQRTHTNARTSKKLRFSKKK
jgi:small subunit ribosomal protein S13